VFARERLAQRKRLHRPYPLLTLAGTVPCASLHRKKEHIRRRKIGEQSGESAAVICARSSNGQNDDNGAKRHGITTCD